MPGCVPESTLRDHLELLSLPRCQSKGQAGKIQETLFPLSKNALYGVWASWCNFWPSPLSLPELWWIQQHDREEPPNKGLRYAAFPEVTARTRCFRGGDAWALSQIRVLLPQSMSSSEKRTRAPSSCPRHDSGHNRSTDGRSLWWCNYRHSWGSLQWRRSRNCVEESHRHRSHRWDSSLRPGLFFSAHWRRFIWGMECVRRETCVLWFCFFFLTLIIQFPWCKPLFPPSSLVICVSAPSFIHNA